MTLVNTIFVVLAVAYVIGITAYVVIKVNRPKRRECPYCQALGAKMFHKDADIPTTLQRCKQIFDAQQCDGKHTLEEFLLR